MSPSVTPKKTYIGLLDTEVAMEVTEEEDTEVTMKVETSSCIPTVSTLHMLTAQLTVMDLPRDLLQDHRQFQTTTHTLVSALEHLRHLLCKGRI